MKNNNLKKIAILGLITGLFGATLSATDKDDKTTSDDANYENEGYHLMTEEELIGNLNAPTKKIYDSLSPEGKKLALEVASQRCNGTNSCRGLNACRTTKNDCAGKGSCRGQTKCAIADKNLAVKLVAKKMAEKRDETTK
jgi:hypothetical protein